MPYIGLFKSQDEALDFFVDLSDEKLQEYVQRPKQDTLKSERRMVFDEHISDRLKELKGAGMTRQFLWERYAHDYGDRAYKNSQFCHSFSDHIARKKLTLCLSHSLGTSVRLLIENSDFHITQ